jgi:uncharacterized protein YukE
MTWNPIQQQAFTTLTSMASANHLTKAQITDFVNSLAHTSLSNALAHSGLTQSEQNTVMKTVTQSMQAQLTDALGADGLQKNKGAGHGAAGGGGSWLEAIAQAMGDALGQMAQKLVDESTSLQGLAGNADGSGAQQFQATMAKFQADSQMFSMLSNAFSNSIKSIGDGMTTMASKQ